MSHAIDKTQIDIGRRELNLQEYSVEDVLSQYIVSEFPNLVQFLQAYFEFEDTEESPSHLIKQLFYTRDITQTDIDLLSYVEDELLLGQAYFEGFPDKREAAKYSSTLYRSKGTKYSIQQFFRTFFNIDPDVIYGKDFVFRVGVDRIGAESQRFITNAELYQQYALLIRSELSTAEWRDVYKLFAHPAGMYVAGEVQIVTAVDLDIETQPEPGVIDIPPFIIESTAFVDEPRAITSATGLFDFNIPDGSGNLFRTTLGNATTYPTLPGNDIEDVQNVTLEGAANLYSSLGEFLEADAPTLDEDSDASEGVAFSGFDISSTETIDQDKFDYVEKPISVTMSDGKTVITNDSDNTITLDELL